MTQSGCSICIWKIVNTRCVFVLVGRAALNLHYSLLQLLHVPPWLSKSTRFYRKGLLCTVQSWVKGKSGQKGKKSVYLQLAFTVSQKVMWIFSDSTHALAGSAQPYLNLKTGANSFLLQLRKPTLGNKSNLLAIRRLAGKALRVHPYPLTHSLAQRNSSDRKYTRGTSRPQDLLSAGRGTPCVNLLGFPKM